MLKQIKKFPYYKKINITKETKTSLKKEIKNPYEKNTNTSRYINRRRRNKLIIDTKFNNKSLSIDKPTQELIKTIKNFLTEPSKELYTNLTTLSNISNLNISKKSSKSKNNKYNKNLVLKTENNIFRKNKKRINKNKYNLVLSNSNYKENKLNIRNINNNYYNKTWNNNNADNIGIDYSTEFDFEDEIEKRMKEIDRLNKNIGNMTNKIKLIKYEISLINNYFNQVNKQLIKVLYNSKTIKSIQKSFDKEIPEIKEEINEMKNKIYFLTQENEIYNLYSFNIINKMEEMQEEGNKIEIINQNIDSEIKFLKKKIFLIQSINTNFKTVLNKKIFY